MESTTTGHTPTISSGIAERNTPAFLLLRYQQPLLNSNPRPLATLSRPGDWVSVRRESGRLRQGRPTGEHTGDPFPVTIWSAHRDLARPSAVDRAYAQFTFSSG
jgi:hypothetical protein